MTTSFPVGLNGPIITTETVTLNLLSVTVSVVMGSPCT
jgi:hypothetical protein